MGNSPYKPPPPPESANSADRKDRWYPYRSESPNKAKPRAIWPPLRSNNEYIVANIVYGPTDGMYYTSVERGPWSAYIWRTKENKSTPVSSKYVRDLAVGSSWPVRNNRNPSLYKLAENRIPVYTRLVDNGNKRGPTPTTRTQYTILSHKNWG